MHLSRTSEACERLVEAARLKKWLRAFSKASSSEQKVSQPWIVFLTRAKFEGGAWEDVRRLGERINLEESLFHKQVCLPTPSSAAG